MPYEIYGLVCEKSSEDFIEALLQAYKQKIRPRCLCIPDGIEMYIAHTGDDKYSLKRMPNSGKYHSPNCENYEIPCELSGRGELDNKAIEEDAATGITKLKLDFSLAKTSITRTLAGDKTTAVTQVKADPTKLTIRSLLHYLYDEAGLNRWSPKMTGKRNWYIVHKYLLNAITNKESKKQALKDITYIAEPFNLEHKDGQIACRRNFLRKFKKQGQKQPVGLIIGEVKTFDSARFGYKLVFKQMPDMPIYLAADVMKKVNKSFAPEIAFFQENESIHLLAICTFNLTASEAPQVDTISLMTVNENWLPFDSMDELDLVDNLTSTGKHFLKGMRYNMAAGDVIASALVIDENHQTEAIYLVPDGADEAYYDQLDSIIELSEIKAKVIDHNENQPENESEETY